MDAVDKVTAAIETNPFASTSNLINIFTGQHAETTVQDQLLNVKEIGTKALAESLEMKQKKTKTVKLQTFATQNKKKGKSDKKMPCSVKSDECVALLRMIQIAASGGDVDIVKYIGNHECSNFPPSLFTSEGQMRTGNKANLIKAIKEETCVASLSTLPETQYKTAVIVDAMFVICHWSFKKEETFGEIALRFQNLLLTDVPCNTELIHFCCDRYNKSSLKNQERQKRLAKSTSSKVYEIREHIHAPDPSAFFAVSDNKAGLLNFLCESWSAQKLTHGNLQLYLGGGFLDETKSVKISGDVVIPIVELESTHEEADTRVILHSIYSVQHDHVERLIIHANDTDVIVLVIYYASNLLKDVPEIWIRTARDSYLPIHRIVAALGQSRCQSLPFIHSLSGRDTTSFFYFISKKVWFSGSKTLNLPALGDFGENPTGENPTLHELNVSVIDQARQLLIYVYSKDIDTEQSLAMLRAHKFLNNRSTLLKLLPPTESTFIHHLQRAALATIIDKTAHLAKPKLPSFKDFGWINKDGSFSPITSTEATWPVELARSISCNCTKGCNTRCSCVKRDLACYIACKCTGTTDRCSQTRRLADIGEMENDTSSSSDEEN